MPSDGRKLTLPRIKRMSPVIVYSIIAMAGAVVLLGVLFVGHCVMTGYRIDKALAPLRTELRLDDKTCPVAYLANRLHSQMPSGLSAEQVEEMIPVYDRIEQFYNDDGSLRGRTYHFVPKSAEAPMSFGIWIRVEFSKDGRLVKVAFES